MSKKVRGLFIGVTSNSMRIIQWVPPVNRDDVIIFFSRMHKEVFVAFAKRATKSAIRLDMHKIRQSSARISLRFFIINNCCSASTPSLYQRLKIIIKHIYLMRDPILLLALLMKFLSSRRSVVSTILFPISLLFLFFLLSFFAFSPFTVTPVAYDSNNNSSDILEFYYLCTYFVTRVHAKK